MNLRLPGINRVILSGNLTSDPKYRVVSSGQGVLNIRIANNLSYKDKNGEWKSRVCYIGVQLWGKAAESIAGRLRKGSPVIVEGELSWHSWETDNGTRSEVEIRAHKIHAVEKREEGTYSPQESSPKKSYGPPTNENNSPHEYDDEIPF